VRKTALKPGAVTEPSEVKTTFMMPVEETRRSGTAAPVNGLPCTCTGEEQAAVEHS